MVEDCIFCKIAKKEIESKFIYENDNFFSIFDISPKVRDHALIISKKHFANVLDMPVSLGSEFLDCVKKTSLKVVQKENAQGFNLHSNISKAAGQLVNHFHFHILPRKTNDGFKPCV